MEFYGYFGLISYETLGPQIVRESKNFPSLNYRAEDLSADNLTDSDSPANRA